jgi:DNA modification methylase
VRTKITILQGDVRKRLKDIPDNSIQCCVTSPPFFGLRDYGGEPQIWGGNSECDHSWEEVNRRGMSGGPSDKQGSNRDPRFEPSNYTICSNCGAVRCPLGLERHFNEFISHLVEIFEEVKRCLHSKGILYLNLGDSYSGSGGPGSQYDSKNPGYGKNFTKFDNPNRKIANLPNKNLCMIPARLAIAMQDSGWILRSDICWEKPNAFVESVQDRPTSSYEHVFMFVKSSNYFFDQENVKEPCVTPADSKVSQTFGAIKGKYNNEILAHSNNVGKKWEYSPMRNIRNVWRIPTVPLSCGVCQICGKYWHRNPPKKHCGVETVAHFASFPERLVELCLKSGSSQHGCCPKCLSPWERIVEKGEPILNAWSMKGMGQYNLKTNEYKLTSLEENSTLKHIVPSRTIGWGPTCNCVETGTPDFIGDGPEHDVTMSYPEPIPCTILDPFFGSGTSGLVASKLGMNCIGIELNENYIKMAIGRLSRELGLLCEIEVKGE